MCSDGVHLLILLKLFLIKLVEMELLLQLCQLLSECLLRP